MSSKKPDILNSAASLVKGAGQSVASTFNSGKDWVVAKFPSKRKTKASDKTASLKQYANLTKRGKSGRAAKSAAKRQRKAAYLATLPKHPVKRLLYRMHPKRFFKYWFSKRGGIMALRIAGLGIATAFLVLIGLFAYFRKDLPDPRNITFEQAARIYDRTGETLLYTYGSDSQIRVLVELDDISDYAKAATVAIEDKGFYQHGGYSISGVTRAAFQNIFGGDDRVQGGSTITQQFIKNALVGDDRTFTRKVKELFLAIELERLYTKDEILSFYLNQIPYGALEYGIEAASNGFFDKPAKDLTIDEAAMIAALPQAPSFYSPYGPNAEDLTGRQHYVIDLMAQQGYITEEEAKEAKDTNTLKKIVPIGQRSAYRDLKAPHFVLKTVNDLVDEYGQATVTQGGMKVITTIDLKIQKIAEKAVNDRYKAGGAMGDNAALVAQDTQTGEVLAYVGSRDFEIKGYGVYDAATPDLGRQPGSSFKPYAYAELFKNPRWSPGSIIWDSSTNFNGYAPHDFDFRFPGPMKVRDAIGRSRNIPAVKALYMAGVGNVIDAAQAQGVKSLCDTCDYGLSLVLGAGEIKLSEHVAGFSTFGRDGEYKPQTYVLKIENTNGEVLKEWKNEEGEQVIDEQVAYIINNILTDDVARSGTFGLGSNLTVPGCTVAAKTGTTDLSVDGWLMGYTRHITAGVWVGNHDSTPMYTFVEPMVGPIWNDFMTAMCERYEDEEFPRPDGIKNVRIDRRTGRNADDKTPSGSIINDIAPSWFEGVKAGSSQKVTIDRVSKKLATDCTPDLAKQESTSNSVAPELPADDPMAAAWAKSAGYNYGSDSKEKDDVHKCGDAKPEITSPFPNPQVIGSDWSVDYKAGTHSISGGQIDWKVDGKVIYSCKIPSGNCSTTHAEYTYSGSAKSNAKVEVEIIDSVYYSVSASQNTNIGSNLVITAAEWNSPRTRFEWSGGTGEVTIYLSGGSDICSSNGNSCNGGFFDNYTGDQVYAKDENGNISPTVPVPHP